jgi:hypothetical protein
MDNAVKATWAGVLATLVAAVIGVAGQLVLDPKGPGGSGSPSAGGQTSTAADTPPARCDAMIREVRRLPLGDPQLAAVLARAGRAALPSLWSTDEIRQCGGVEPETLLEGALAAPGTR